MKVLLLLAVCCYFVDIKANARTVYQQVGLVPNALDDDGDTDMDHDYSEEDYAAPIAVEDNSDFVIEKKELQDVSATNKDKKYQDNKDSFELEDTDESDSDENEEVDISRDSEQQQDMARNEIMDDIKNNDNDANENLVNEDVSVKRGSTPEETNDENLVIKKEKSDETETEDKNSPVEEKDESMLSQVLGLKWSDMERTNVEWNTEKYKNLFQI